MRFHGLTIKEYDILMKWAEGRARVFSGKAIAVGAEDLLHEAIVQSLKPTRVWYPKKTGFIQFIGGCIRNIAFGEIRRTKDTVPAETLASPLNEEARMNEAIHLNWVHEELRLLGHPYAVEIFDLLRYGYSGPEIRKILGITPQTYGAAYKWLRRRFTESLYANAGLYALANNYMPFWDGVILEHRYDEGRVERARTVVEAATAEARAMSQAADSAL